MKDVFDYDDIMRKIHFFGHSEYKYMNVFVWEDGEQTYGEFETLEEALEFDKLISSAKYSKIVKIRD